MITKEVKDSISEIYRLTNRILDYYIKIEI